ncbi:MAG: hypothetical protein U0836_05825 [Pirellulales bacterium]
MNFSRFDPRSLGGLFGWALLVSVLGATARSEDVLLQWQFQKGEMLHYTFPQTTTTSAHVGGQNLETKTDSRADVSLLVKSVDPEGNADARLSLERMRIDIKAPQLGVFHYDSAGRQRTTGYMENVIAGYDALAKRSFHAVIDGRGDLLSVSLPEKEVQDLAADKLPLDNLLTPKGLSQFLGLNWPRLPAKAVAVGHTWEERAEVVNLALGKVQSTRTYKFDGPVDRAGKQLEKISYTVELAAEDQQQRGGVSFKVLRQQSVGEAYFDRAAGRFVEGKSKMELTLLTDTGSQQFEQQVVTEGAFVLLDAKQAGEK